MNAFRAELRKLWTVRTTWVLTLMGWGLVTLSTSTGLFSTLTGARFAGTDEQIADAIGQIGASAMIVLIVALLAVTTEFRHRTIGRTLQLTPSRSAMLAAKMGASVAYALAYFLTSLAIVGALLLLAGQVNAAALEPGAATQAALWQSPVGLVLNAVLGLAVGALVRSQVVAITATLVWLFLVENLVAALQPAIARWLPFQALNSLFVSQEVAAGAREGGMALLQPATALAVFLAYVTVAATAAVVLLRTRDV
jgi:ABC-2 type transport system permease protein